MREQPARLKREFGRYLTFWGGIDSQHVQLDVPPENVVAMFEAGRASVGAA